MTAPQPIAIECRPEGPGWRCTVTVGDDAAATSHDVRVERDVLERLAPGAVGPDDLVRASFEFMLAREPRESILRSFDLTVIGRYFPEWEAEIRR